MGYSDTDWAGDCTDYKSTSGYLFQIGGTVVTWKSKKQSCVALSTPEAEYMALSSASQEAIWMRELNSDLGNQQSQPTLILEDNQSAIAMTKNPQYHGRSNTSTSSFILSENKSVMAKFQVLSNRGHASGYVDQKQLDLRS